MEFQIPIQIKYPEKQLKYTDKILLVGSCFTEHIGNALDELKFEVLQNPNGILFDPASVCKSLVSYTQNRQYSTSDLFQLNEVWHSWDHHSRFSNTNAEEAITLINHSQNEAYKFLKNADWLIVTLGSSFSYRLADVPHGRKGEGVANCHRAPAQWFDKHLLAIDEIVSMLDNCYHQLLRFNPNLKIIFTVSPVRHVRDGVVENNRSKARLIEAVHHIVNKFQGLYYFPAYELVIDVLRDYRFYDVDMAHPNYQATHFVLENFTESFIESSSRQLTEDVKKIIIARKHKPFQPATTAHKLFLKAHAEKAKELMQQHPFLDFTEEINYFMNGQ